MKNFLRILVILFLLITGFTIVRSGILSSKQTVNSLEGQETAQETEVTTEEQIPTTQDETLEEIVDPAGPDEGVIILGGDGIPNN